MDMSKHVRLGWLKFMYWYTIVGASGFGLGMLLIPGVIQKVFFFPVQDPIVFGLAGSVFAALGLLSILGLRAPMRYVPLLVFQFCYKIIWLIAVVLPRVLSGSLPLHAMILLGVFATYIIGDLIAIPFPAVFSKQPETRTGVMEA